MFTNSCIILKNTKHLRNKLEEFGYKIPLCSSYYEGRNRGLLCRPNLAIGVPDDCHDFKLDKYLENNPYIINCGTNEDLFLALAALRDDTDKNQWFVYDDKDDNPDERQIFWFICEEDKIEDDMWLDQAYLDCHKATVQELIQHFKDK